MRERTIEKIRAAIKELSSKTIKEYQSGMLQNPHQLQKTMHRLYIKLYLSSVPDLKDIGDSKSVPVLNSVPDSNGVPDLENMVDSKGVPDSNDMINSESVPDFMYTTPEERANATMAYLNDSSKRVVTRDIIEMNEIVNMLFSDF